MAMIILQHRDNLDGLIRAHAAILSLLFEAQAGDDEADVSNLACALDHIEAVVNANYATRN